MKRIILIVALVLVCGLLMAASRNGCTVETGSSTTQEMELTESNHQRLMAAVPPPQLKTSLERMQLKRRLERFNVEGKISYVYLISFGQVVSYYPIKGKVSSINSKLTTQQQMIDDPNGTAAAGSCIVESPALDGSYGTNGDAVFFFTTEDIYVEWNGEYLLCDEPLKVTIQPKLVRQID